ncbi:restriction endonuclease [Streptomyces sp. NPDC021056]|uniref:restriction endonuclease n=1 Tax=Streptomyces sp. NPDC021056 TaxID=3155012 RepID=UPI0033C9A02F
MTATQPTPRTYKSRTTPRRRRPLPRITLTGAIVLAVVIMGAAKTWPIATGIILGLIAGGAVLTVTRPRRLTGLWQLLDRLPERAPGLPAHGYRDLDWFLALHHRQFEHAIAALCVEHDDIVHQAQVVGGANDRGADVLVHLKDGRRVMIQCKRYDGHNVTSGDVQKTNGTYRDIHGCHAAVIVTTAGFTRDAIDTNARFRQPIRLVDGHALVQWANGGHAPW